MKTRTHPLDYVRPRPIVPQLIHLCSVCGGHMSMRLSDEVWYCVDCGGEDFEMILDSEAADYRAVKRVSPWLGWDEPLEPTGREAVGLGRSGPF